MYIKHDGENVSKFLANNHNSIQQTFTLVSHASNLSPQINLAMTLV
jgi:hypothetical protein